MSNLPVHASIRRTAYFFCKRHLSLRSLSVSPYARTNCYTFWRPNLMNRTLLLIVVSLLSVNGFAQTRRAARAVTAPTLNAKVSTQTLPIRRVILYSNGVAYIERRGTVTGHAEINLSFKQSQVDDVLKSMVVLDLGQGRIGAGSYNSSAPPAARLADIPFSVEPRTQNENQGGLARLLTQLHTPHRLGATANRPASGSIPTVAERTS